MNEYIYIQKDTACPFVASNCDVFINAVNSHNPHRTYCLTPNIIRAYDLCEIEAAIQIAEMSGKQVKFIPTLELIGRVEEIRSSHEVW